MKKILIIQTAFIGDVILATSVLEKVHRFFPDAKIDFLVRKGNEPLLNEHPFLHSVVIWNKKEKKYISWFRVLKRIRSEHYDHVINLQRFFSSGALTVLSGAKETIGFDKNPLSFFFSRRLPHVIGTNPSPGGHEVNRCLKLVEHLTDTSFQMPALYPTIDDVEKIKPLSACNFITISPTSVWFTKQLPAEEWIQMIKRLPALQIYLLGAPSDREACETIAVQSGHPAIQNLAGKLSLLQSAALMQRAKMNYTNDSAPMHLCSAMQAPVTAVFCSTIPAFGFGPLSPHSVIVETHEALSCRPCGLHGYTSCPLGHFKCSVLNIDDLTMSLTDEK